MYVYVSKVLLCTVFLTYFTIAVLVVPYMGRDLPYSKFYQSTKKRDQQKNLEDNLARLQHARSLLSRYKVNPLSKEDPNILPEFCFIVISVSRPANMEFLTQVVAGLVTQLNSVFAVYNAEGSTHTEVQKLPSTIPVITKAIKQSAVAKSKFAKEKDDMVFALQWCHNKRARYTVVFQDDALPLPDFMTRLRFVLKQHLLHKQNWALLKLFYPPKWQGWSNELKSIQELLSTSLIGSLILTTITLLIRMLYNRRFRYPNKCETFLLFALSFSLVLYSLWTLGRPHWLVFLGKMSPHINFIVPAPGCCIPAVLYPQEYMKSLIGYLKSVNCSSSFPADIALDKFVDNNHLKQFLVVPDLIKHIGFVSSLGKGWKDPTEFRF